MALVSNGFVELKNGMNSTRDPVLLADSQCSRAINVAFRGGLATTRPAFSRLGVDLPSGVFRGMGRWSLETGDLFALVIGTGVYTLKLDTLELVRHMTFANGTSQCFFVQASQFMVIQDGAGDVAVLEDTDGVVSVSTSENSIPAGTFGVYAHGRIHMVPLLVPNTEKSGRAYLVSGDVMLPDEPESVLKFTETEYLDEGGAHSMPIEMGFLGGVGVLRNSNTGTGMGSVVAFGRNGVCAFDFSISRDLWKDQSISQALYFGAGCRSPWSVVNLNDDLVYRGLDGIRTLKYTASTVAASSGALSNSPLSIEVSDFLSGDSGGLGAVSMSTCDDRLFCTAGVYGSSRFRGLVSWDVAASFYNGTEGLSAYDGLWTGCVFAQIASALMGGRMRMFVMSAGNKLYYLDNDAVFDADSVPIEARIETKAYNFGDLVTTKKLSHVDMFVHDVSTDTEFKVWYRPSGYPLWKLLGTRNVSVPAGSLPQTRRRLRFSVDFSDENCDPITSQPLYVATAFQFAVQWTGRATIGGLQAQAEAVAEQPPDPCDELGAVLSETDASGESFSDFSYHFED